MTKRQRISYKYNDKGQIQDYVKTKDKIRMCLANKSCWHDIKKLEYKYLMCNNSLNNQLDTGQRIALFTKPLKPRDQRTFGEKSSQSANHKNSIISIDRPFHFHCQRCVASLAINQVKSIVITTSTVRYRYNKTLASTHSDNTQNYNVYRNYTEILQDSGKKNTAV